MRRRIVVALLVLATAGCRQPAAPSSAPPTAAAAGGAPAALRVKTAPVEVRAVPQHLTLTGSLLAHRQSEVAASVSGRIVATHVERGQAVKAGQPLAVVDSKAAGLSASAAAAQSRVADAQVSQAQADCERARMLFEQGAISQAEHDRLKTACTAQLHSASAARANADLAAKLAGDTVIRAPFDGVVGERYVTVGEYVQPPTRVASLYAVDPVRVQVSVPEPVVGLVHEGQTLELQVAAWPRRRFPASVKYVSPALRPSSRDLLVEALAPNKDGALRPGMFATVLLKVGEEQQPTVPAEAVRDQAGVKRLFLVQGGRALERVVRTGAVREGRVALLEALEAGERVVVSPPAALRDGMPLELEADHAVAR